MQVRQKPPAKPPLWAYYLFGVAIAVLIWGWFMIFGWLWKIWNIPMLALYVFVTIAILVTSMLVSSK